MRILVTGAQGQLGSDIIAELDKRKIEYIATDINMLDITDKNSVDNYFDNNDYSVRMYSPDLHIIVYNAMVRI